MHKHKAFTLIEVIVVLAIIAIMSAILIPTLLETYNNSKEEIVEIANKETTVIIMRDGEILEQGTDIDISKYTIISIDYKDSTVIIYVE